MEMINQIVPGNRYEVFVDVVSMYRLEDATLQRVIAVSTDCNELIKMARDNNMVNGKAMFI